MKIGVVGGTFSLLHSGHKHLLRKAAHAVDKLIIGVTSDQFVKKLKKEHPVEPFTVRIEKIVKFLQEEHLLKKCMLVKIDDFMGPAGSRKDLDMIIVTDETLLGALEINAYRVKRKLNPLAIFVVDTILDERGFPISSTRLWTIRDFSSKNKGTSIVPSYKPKEEK
ncbi:MAG: phosphopantetheine adenylyltransferase [Thermoprotei archaeon]|nr:MAG: phosphopantetheine adenylyltransferase [Thermoprotei archaeon]